MTDSTGPDFPWFHGSGEPVSPYPVPLVRGAAGMTGSPDSRKRGSGRNLPPVTE